MDSRVLNKKGTSLLEVTAILLIIGLILSVAIPNYMSRIKNANYQKTIKELTAIAQAGVDYYVSRGSWPAAISQLAPGFIPYAVVSSPFGTDYQINGMNDMVTASVLIPTGIAQTSSLGQLLTVINQGAQDLIEISKTVKNDFTSRLTYDLKHVYE